jgi:hypothetical protein
MIAASDRLEVLYRTPDELEAAMIAGVLADHGIAVTTSGGYTSGFRAEAPGHVRVLVAQDDLAEACELLAQTLRESRSLDWDGIDIQDPTPIDADEADAAPSSDAAVPSADDPKLQFSLGLLVILQTVLCVAFALSRIDLGGIPSAILLTGLVFSVTLAGTIYIAADLPRFHDRWRPFGRVLITGYAVAILLSSLMAILAG